jgi:hypothetical protein
LHESLFGELVLLDVGLVKLNAALKDLNKLFAWVVIMVPKNVIVLWSTFLTSSTHLYSSEVKNVELTVGNHLVGDFSEKTGHSLVGVVVSSDSVDHLDTVHQSWKSLFNGLWSSFIEWLDEFFECLKILNVILGFVQSFGNSKLNCSPFGCGKVDLISWLTNLLGSALGSSGENGVDGSAVLASELL